MARKVFPVAHVLKARRANSGEPVESVERKIWLLLELLRHRSVGFATYERLCERSDRSFKRDLQHLRSIGERTGFTISYTQEGSAELETVDAALRHMDKTSKALAALLRSAAQALGAPVEREIGMLPGEASDGDQRFLYFALPQLLEGGHAAAVFAALKKAWASSARVRLHYAEGKERVVEPYIVINRSGRYYLVGFDVAKGKGWRYFALDQIEKVPQAAGTFIPRPLDDKFLSGDTIGMLQTGAAATEVRVELSSTVSASATSRVWQKRQKIEYQSDGRAFITFTVSEPDEAVRWALGFATEARIVSPPKLVERALTMLRRMVGEYARL